MKWPWTRTEDRVKSLERRLESIADDLHHLRQWREYVLQSLAVPGATVYYFTYKRISGLRAFSEPVRGVVKEAGANRVVVDTGRQVSWDDVAHVYPPGYEGIRPRGVLGKTYAEDSEAWAYLNAPTKLLRALEANGDTEAVG